MTCSVLGLQKWFLCFHQLTRLMIRWLAGESVAFHQLTGCKFVRCAGESSALAQNELSPPKMWFYQTHCVSTLSPCIFTTTWASTCRSGCDFCFCFNFLIFLLKNFAKHHRLYNLCRFWQWKPTTISGIISLPYNFLSTS